MDSTIGRVCSNKKPCCIHRCCNAQGDEACCPSCEPKASNIEWSAEKGFHKVGMD